VAAEGKHEGAAVVAAVEGEAAVTLSAGATEFIVLPEVGLLGSALRHRNRDYLDLHGGAVAARGGHTTGLPLLSPWANRLAGSVYRVGSRTVDLVGAHVHRDASGLPMHGTMIGRPGWEIVSVRTQTGSASLVARFDAAADDEVMASFPFPHELAVGFTVTPGRLTIATTISATGRRPVPVSFGWHPYFRLPETPRDRLRLGLPARHRLVLDDRQLPTGTEVVESAEIVKLSDRVFDDGYRLGRDRQLLLASGRRRLSIVLDRNYSYAQVYAPAGSDFVALEPMTASTAALSRGETPIVEPGDRFTARFAVSLT
jgi:aldose 1-epimerase